MSEKSGIRRGVSKPTEPFFIPLSTHPNIFLAPHTMKFSAALLLSIVALVALDGVAAAPTQRGANTADPNTGLLNCVDEMGDMVSVSVSQGCPSGTR
jgi:hypothetical protein